MFSNNDTNDDLDMEDLILYDIDMCPDAVRRLLAMPRNHKLLKIPYILDNWKRARKN